ncbi:MAG: hypothetical protein AB7P04_06840 [Bacteriovoracia bacterium]
MNRDWLVIAAGGLAWALVGCGKTPGNPSPGGFPAPGAPALRQCVAQAPVLPCGESLENAVLYFVELRERCADGTDEADRQLLRLAKEMETDCERKR